MTFYILTDIRGINSIAVQAVNSGMIIVGGGVIKHHTANANLMVGLLNIKIHVVFTTKILKSHFT